MRVLISTTVLSGILAMGLTAQKLETQPLDTKKIIRVETARDHLTVIELGDPVTMVAVGNQNAFTIERRENKVFVRPAEDGAKTNLFIWTNTGRFAYELVPAETVEQMHFAIDQKPATIAANISPLPDRDPAEKASPLPADMLTKAKPIILHGSRKTQARVEIALRDLYRDGNRLCLRYAVINHSAHAYRTARPAVWRLAGIRSAKSLAPLGEHQLSERLIRSLKAKHSSRLEVIEAGQVAHVAAGGQGMGWLVVAEPVDAGDEVSALRLEFAADAKETVSAVLVLSPRNNRQEVANGRTAGE
jgi:hypothetical protein